jgi:hypothetical protein
MAVFSWHQIIRFRCPREYVLRRTFKQAIAVVLGNVLYFFAIMPHLPAAGRHRPDRFDLGLIVDFWVCVAMYGVVELVDRKWGHR